MTTTRFYVTDGPMATSMSECAESYFREGLASDTGGIGVVHCDGSMDLIAGNRYLTPGTTIRAEVIDHQLQIIYLGVVIKAYENWNDYTEVTCDDYPLGRRG